MDGKVRDSEFDDGNQSASDSNLLHPALPATARSSSENLSVTNMGQTSSVRSPHTGELQSQESETPVHLCGVCKSMFSTLDGLKALVSENGYEYVSFEEIDDIQRSCSLCRLLKEGGFMYHLKEKLRLRAEPLVLNPSTTEDIYPEYPLKILSASYLSIIRPHWRTEPVRKLLTMRKIPGDDSAPWLSYSPQSYPLAGDDTMKACMAMLKQCQEEHESCESLTVPFLPTRVINLQDPNHPKLYISDQNQQAFYVALSYCWGGPQDVLLTVDTLDARSQGLCLEELSQTIRDAIEVTAKLGYRYLWIDALCIIQDNQKDKRTEIEAMGSIYRNATLTIAASDAKGAREGFLRSLPKIPTCKLPFYLPNNRLGNIEVEQYRLYANQENWHLNTRAWTMQEELLSPRMLFFADGEIRWQCQSVYKKRVLGASSVNLEAWQGVPRLPREVFLTTGNTKYEALHSPEGNTSHVRILKEQQDIWPAIIKNYTSRNITDPLDRLPALAGIIGELEKVWVDECIAGLWNKSFLENLLWQKAFPNYQGCTAPIYKGCDCSSSPKTRPNVAAPTWSWLSCEQAVIFENNLQFRNCELISCSVQLQDEDAPKGLVKSGQLVIRASVIKGPIHRNPGPELYSPLSPIYISSIYPCGFTCHEIFKRAIYARIGSYSSSGWEDPSKDPKNKLIARGLVLMEVGNGLFERVGVFKERVDVKERPQGMRDVFDEPGTSEWKTLTVI